MSQSRTSVYASFIAGDTLSAQRIVAMTASNTVNVPQTITNALIGITQDAVDSGSAANVVIRGSAKCICNSSISTGALVTAVTATGYATAASHSWNTTTSVVPKLIGYAVHKGSTNSIIEIMVEPSNINKVAFA